MVNPVPPRPGVIGPVKVSVTVFPLELVVIIPSPRISKLFAIGTAVLASSVVKLVGTDGEELTALIVPA